MKTLLIISGGIEAVPGITLAKAMGLFVVVADGDPEAPGFEYADDHFVSSTYDIAGTVQKARDYHTTKRNFDGVMCIASDVPLTVASVAAELGLPGIPIAAARLAMDKLAMKDKFLADGIAIPSYRPIHSPQELSTVIDQWQFPVIIKPVDSRGARGVLKLTEATDLAWGWEHTLMNSPSGRVMAEKFLDGPQVSTESIVLNGECHTVGFSDRNYEYLEKYAPHIIENGGDLPSCLPSETQTKVKYLVAQAAASIGVTDGIIKGDVVVHHDRPFIIEVATRLSGGYFCTHEIPLNTGVDFVGNAIKMSIGEQIDRRELIPRKNTYVCQRYIMKKNGKIQRYSTKEAEKSTGVIFLDNSMNVGDKISGPINSNGWAVMVICTGNNRADAQQNACSALDKVSIEMTDE